MKCIMSPFRSCYQNIASEEYYLSHFDEDIFYLYINSPCIVVGNNQNTYSEINQKYVQEHGIDVVRRLSGGGAVYHDHGNLNYGFITKNTGQSIDDIFRELTRPILKVLQDLGADARFSGRNDLVIDGKKISGIAQYHTAEKTLLHGTLLFSSDLAKLSACLNADPRKFEDKSVKSIQSRVSNIRPFLSKQIDIEEFSSIIMESIMKMFPGSSMYELTEQDKAAIEKLANTKYATWEWVYGNSPEFTYQKTIKYEKGIVHIGLNVSSGIIQEISIQGDFFGKKNIEQLKKLLTNISYKYNSIESALAEIDLSDYIFGLSKKIFIDSLFS